MQRDSNRLTDTRVIDEPGTLSLFLLATVEPSHWLTSVCSPVVRHYAWLSALVGDNYACQVQSSASDNNTNTQPLDSLFLLLTKFSPPRFLSQVRYVFSRAQSWAICWLYSAIHWNVSSGDKHGPTTLNIDRAVSRTPIPQTLSILSDQVCSVIF